MHPMLFAALEAASHDVHCEAAIEPMFEGLRRSLTADSPRPVDFALLSDYLQLATHLASSTQAGLVRALEWAQSATVAGEGRRPVATLTAVTEGLGFALLLEVDGPPPNIWNSPGHPQNTVLFLREGEFVTQTVPVDHLEHWSVQQARFQACGVFSSSLANLAKGLRTVTELRIGDWPCYSRDGEKLVLEMSRVEMRAALRLRQESVALHSAAEGAEHTFIAALKAMGLHTVVDWQALRMHGHDVGEVLGRVRSAGGSKVVRAQVLAAIQAEDAWATANAASEGSEAATRELRRLRAERQESAKK